MRCASSRSTGPMRSTRSTTTLHVGLAKIWERARRGRRGARGGDHRCGPGVLGRRRLQLPRRAAQRRGAARKDDQARPRDRASGMVRCRIPVVAAVNGPAVGLGCSLVALSDIVYMAETAYFADPHVQIGLVAADGGPLIWPLADQPAAGQGVRVDRRADQRRSAPSSSGWPTTSSTTRWPRRSRVRKKILELPQQAVESTKRLMNIQLEQSVMASLDYANLAGVRVLRDRRLQQDRRRPDRQEITPASDRVCTPTRGVRVAFCGRSRARLPSTVQDLLRLCGIRIT